MSSAALGINTNFTYRSKKFVHLGKRIRVAYAGSNRTAPKRAQKPMRAGRAVKASSHRDACAGKCVGGLRRAHIADVEADDACARGFLGGTVNGYAPHPAQLFEERLSQLALVHHNLREAF